MEKVTLLAWSLTGVAVCIYVGLTFWKILEFIDNSISLEIWQILDMIDKTVMNVHPLLILIGALAAIWIIHFEILKSRHVKKQVL
jgi:hypothetical protein